MYSLSTGQSYNQTVYTTFTNSSNGQSINQTTIYYSSNSSYEYNETIRTNTKENSTVFVKQWNYTYWSLLFDYQEDIRWNVSQWYNHVQTVVLDRTSWNFTAWYSYMLMTRTNGFTCDATSFVQTETATVLTLFDALHKSFVNRSDSCHSLKESVLLIKSILKKCKEEKSRPDVWESSSRRSVLLYSRILHIDVLEAIYRLVCTASSEDITFSDESAEVGNEPCDHGPIVNYLLVYLRLKPDWDDIRVCKEVSQAVEAVKMKVSTCEWELSSVISLLLSPMQNMESIICTPPSCNIQYAALCVGNAEVLWHTYEQNITLNKTLSVQNITTASLDDSFLSDYRHSECRKLKFDLACVTNHTIDCQSTIYESISSRLEKVSGIFKQLCPDYLPTQRTCLIEIMPNVSKTTEPSLLLNNSVVNEFNYSLSVSVNITSSREFCECDPAAAINCIIDIHHLAKQPFPDWEGICPLVSESKLCAYNYVAQCDECKRTTVMSIVSKLNRKLEEECVEPPISVCTITRAMKCIKDLSDYYAKSKFFDINSICMQITLARSCIFGTTLGCDELSIYSAKMQLEQVIKQWKLECNGTEDQLISCLKIFQNKVYSIIEYDNHQQYMDTSTWTQMSSFCEEIKSSWSCVDATLKLQSENVHGKIIRKSLLTLNTAIEQLCKPKGDTLQCYSCQGEGTKTCVDRTDLETCKNNQICETVTEAGKPKSRGCKPVPSCKAGCFKDSCTYCCSNNLCNYLDNGPLEGLCNMTALASCVLSLSSEFIQTNRIQCSSVNATLQCIEKEQANCERGGRKSLVMPFTKLKLSDEMEKCNIQEADQTCDLGPLIATSTYIITNGLQINEEALCKIVNKSKSQVEKAETLCNINKVKEFKETHSALESIIGGLNCTNKDDSILEDNCRPLDAVNCITVLFNMEVMNNNSCLLFNETTKCVRDAVMNCTTACQLIEVKSKFELLKSKYSNICKTDVSIIETDLPMKEIAECFLNFIRNVQNKSSSCCNEAFNNLFSCLTSIKQDIFLKTTDANIILMELFLNFIEDNLENKISNLSFEVPPECAQNLDLLISYHVEKLVSVPFLSISERKSACVDFDNEQVLKAVATNCNNSLISETYELLDRFRMKFINYFCDIKPISRCFISQAEDCLLSLSTSFGPNSIDESCMRAQEMIECANSYTSNCKYEEVVNFQHSPSVIAISEQILSCTQYSETIKEARCDLLGRIVAQSGCNNSIECSNFNTCRDAEQQAACLIQSTGSCTNESWSTHISEQTSKIAMCRYGQGNATISLVPCSQLPYKCDFNRSKQCLKSIYPINQSIETSDEKLQEVKDCLEKNYCFKPVLELFNENISVYYELLQYISRITPNWDSLESEHLKQILIFPSYAIDALIKEPPVNLSLWNNCWRLYNIFSYIRKIQNINKDNFFPTVNKTVTRLSIALKELCYSGLIEDLELPDSDIGELPHCPVVQIRSDLNLNLARVISGLNTPSYNFPVCRYSVMLQEKFDTEISGRCSPGIIAETKFTLKVIQILLEDICVSSKIIHKRCDINMVKECVNKLYRNIQNLGINQTKIGLCQILEQTDNCVERNSFMCDKFSLSNINSMYKSVRQLATVECDTDDSTSVLCQGSNMEEPTAKCDIKKASVCTFKQIKGTFNFLVKNKDKCKSLNENLHCAKKYTANCDSKIIPQLSLLDTTIVDRLQNKYECGLKQELIDNFGCRPGCWINEAKKCFERYVPKLAVIYIKKDTCQYVNELKSCISMNISQCNNDESKLIFIRLKSVLEKIPGLDIFCTDLLKCAQEFDNIVRRLQNLQPESDISITGYVPSRDNGNTSDNNDANTDLDSDTSDNSQLQETMDNSPFNLNTLCVQATESWECLQNGLKNLPKMKRNILSLIYESIWEIVTKKCYDTRDLTCYYCKNVYSAGECTIKTETCPINKRACMFKQILTGKGLKYIAGCTPVSSCKDKESGNQRTSCCTTSLCNTLNQNSTSVIKEPLLCQLNVATECALNFAIHYTRSDDINCRDATANLGCIKNFGSDCTEGYKMIKASEEIFLYLAKTKCVIDLTSDCNHLSIDALQTILSNGLITQENVPCLALDETEKSIKKIILSGKCTESDQVSMEQSLDFLSSIVYLYCKKSECSKTLTVFNESESCLGKIFKGIKYIYKSFDLLKERIGQLNCSEFAINVWNAHRYLNNCNISKLISVNLDKLDLQAEKICGVNPNIQLSQVCPGTCQVGSIISFIADIIKNASNKCLYIAQVPEAYNAYASGCSSIQQKDVVSYIEFTLGNYIEICRNEHPDFSFVLELKEDIYHRMIICQKTFEENVQTAFMDDSPIKVCASIPDFKNCLQNVPSLLENFIIGPTKQCIKNLEATNICSYSDDDRVKRESSINNLTRLAFLCKNILTVHFESAPLEIRKIYCQKISSIVDESESLAQQFSNSLSTFQKTLIRELINNLNSRKKNFCRNGDFEEDKCELNMTSFCRKEFEMISQFAMTEAITLCSQAKFALECTERFSKSCDTAEDRMKAQDIQWKTKMVIKQAVGNICPFLTTFLYCNDTLSDALQACRVDEAKKCMDQADFDFTMSYDQTFCRFLQNNISCVQNAMIGCQADQIKALGWASKAKQGFCNIQDASLNSVCVSTPLCSSKAVIKCFTSDLTNCSSLQKTISCVNDIMERNKQCSESWEIYLARHFLSTYYGKLYQNCNLASEIMVPQLFNFSCLNNLVKDVELVLVVKFRTIDQTMKYFLSRLVSCLQSEEKIIPIVSMLYDISLQLYSSITTDTLVTYNKSTDEQFQDTDTCSYSQARACLSYEILRITTVKLLSVDEKNELCDSVAQNTVTNCIEKALARCPGEKMWFLGNHLVWDNLNSKLGICKPQQLCTSTEVYSCVHLLAATLNQTNDSESFCNAQIPYQQCMDSVLLKCKGSEMELPTDALMRLYNESKSKCNDTHPPPAPICPQIPQRNRVCHLGKAVQCGITLNNNLLKGGDSLIWRLWCRDLQSMMYCVATNTTSCPENMDLKDIIDSLDALRSTARNQCPWNSDDLCSEEKFCPVVNAGCDSELERELLRQEKTVCENYQQAVQCVVKNTATCNLAQKSQALAVIKKKLENFGLPKDLSCENNSFDGCLFSFLSAAMNIYTEGQNKESCLNITTQYKCIASRIANPNNSTYIDLGRKLVAELYKKLNDSHCSVNTTSAVCLHRPPFQKISYLISQLTLNEDFHTTSFCAQSLDLIEEMKYDNCSSGLSEILKKSSDFEQKCTESISCFEAEQKIQMCLKVFSNESCFGKEAALCITKNKPPSCPYNESWIFKKLCDHTVVLVSTGQQKSKNYVSEAGLKTIFSWKLMAGTTYLKILMSAKPVNSNTIPRCLEGSQLNDPIPQIYTEKNPKALENDTTEVKFNIYARQDYKKDGPVSIDVKFTVIPCEMVNGTLLEVNNASFILSLNQIEVDDRDLKKSWCSSINDPHMETFDGVKYNNMGDKSYILYRSTKHPAAVIAHFKSCASYGTCNCGVQICVGNETLTLSDCSTTQFITYETISGAISADQQELRIFYDNDLRTYYIIILRTWTIVKVVRQDIYLNIYILPSAQDFGSTEGQCGTYDGYSANDLLMPDSKVYKVVETDTDNNVLTPTAFNEAWQIFDTSVLSNVYAQGVEISRFSAPVYCYGWTNDPICSFIGHLEKCGTITGEDQTEQFKEMLSQVQSSGGNRRKRQVENKNEDSATNKTHEAGWPTRTGWTLETATLYCLDNLLNKPLEACRDAVLTIDTSLKSIDFDTHVQWCIDDIRLSGGTEWMEGTRQVSSHGCWTEMNYNPKYQNEKQSNDLAMAFLNLTCLPYNCNNHGSCDKGKCICDTGYFGIGCNFTVDQLEPPQLEIPEENVHKCEISEKSDCSAVYLTGSGFISSSLLSCHIKELVEGITKAAVVNAYILSQDLVRCNLGTKSVMKRLLQISVSNNGRNPDPHYQNFLAYDPICYTCNTINCKKNTDVCFIGTKCVAEGEKSIYNDCEYCDLINPNKWSIYKDVPGCKDDTTQKSENDTSVLPTALIAAGITLLALLIVLTIVLFIYVKRRVAARKQESAFNHRHANQAYQDSPPFYGQPILAVNTKMASGGKPVGPNFNDSA